MINVRVPATTANVGSGFDAVGIALNLYNEITITECDTELEIISTNPELHIPRTKKNFIYKTIAHFFGEMGINVPNMKIVQNDCIPMTRGLGSSAACIVAGLFAANELCDKKLSRDELLNMAVKIEGHPDNVAPAILGGAVIGATDFQADSFKYVRTEIENDISFVTLIPDFPLSTDEARNILPHSIDFKDAVFNISRAALLAASLVTKNWNNLDLATQDLMHQPYRKKIIPNMDDIISVLKSNGAKGCFLSGAGPTIIAIVECSAEQSFVEGVINEISAFTNNWHVKVLNCDNKGVVVKRK